MKTVTSAKVMLLAKGKEISIKQMEAKAEDLLPKHLATTESVIVVLEGECVMNLEGNEHTLQEEDSFLIPANQIHQIRVVKNFKALHMMPNDIKFQFFE